MDIVLNGSDLRESTMPTFSDRLSTGDVLAILEYFKVPMGPR